MLDPSVHMRPPRRPGRPQRTTRADLVAAATELGLNAFTMRDVAALVGVGISTAYTYVTGRDQLFAEAASALLEQVDIGGDHPTWTSYIDTIAERFFALARQHPGLGDYILTGPYTPATVEVFDAVITRVRSYNPGIPEHVGWLISSGPVSISIGYLGDPVLEPMSPWIRAALIEGLDAKLRAGTLPDAPTVPWRTKIETPGPGPGAE